MGEKSFESASESNETNIATKNKTSKLSTFSKEQKNIAYVFYGILVVAFIVIVAGAIMTFADLVAPTGKIDLFLSLTLGYQISIVAGFLAGLFFMLVLFFGIYRKGTLVLLNVLFKKRGIELRYQKRLAVRIVAAGLLLSLITILLGLLFAIVQEFIWGSIDWPFSLTSLLASLSIGQFILFLGFLILLIESIVLFIIYFWRNGYYLILKLIGGLEKE